jgi:hypothetical protein
MISEMEIQMTKNLHIEHPEDTILTGDLSCLDWFTAGGNLSVKLDGSPAIVWGVDPACGEFFVGTKGVFNKKKIRIAHNHEEIDLFYVGDVAEILHTCFNVLPRTETIYQADFIGFGGSTEYKSNLLTYRFPEIVTQSIIIAPHTCYYAESDLRHAEAYPDNATWNDTQHIKFVKPDAWIMHNQDAFYDVEDVCNFARQMAQTVNFVSDKELSELKKQLNSCIRDGHEVEDDAFECDPNLIRLWKLVKSIKEDCLFLCCNDGPEAYLGYDRIDSEGYVMVNKYGMYKLVNREVFSHANFNMQKNWNK